MRDWKRSTLGADARLQPWLRDAGSLTRRIMLRSERFSVKILDEGKTRVAQDESRILGIAPGHLVWSRDVFLHADDRPVVFAHSACRLDALNSAWQSLRGLGTRPLGAVLFSHPEVVRLPLHYNALGKGHPLYKLAAFALNAPPARMWARRSLFYLHREPLLVTEVFLPDILELGAGEPGSGRTHVKI